MCYNCHLIVTLRHLPDGLDSLIPEPLRFDDLEIPSPAQGPPQDLFRFRHVDLKEEAPVTVFGELLRCMARFFADERCNFRCEPYFDVLGFLVRGIDSEDVGPSAGEVVFAQIRENESKFAHAAYPTHLEAADLLAFNTVPVQVQEPIYHKNLIRLDFVIFGRLARFAIADADAPAVDGGLEQVIDDPLLP